VDLRTKCQNNHQHDCGHPRKEEEEEEYVQCCFTSSELQQRLVGTGSPGRPTRLSHSSRALYPDPTLTAAFTLLPTTFHRSLPFRISKKEERKKKKKSEWILLAILCMRLWFRIHQECQTKEEAYS